MGRKRPNPLSKRPDAAPPPAGSLNKPNRSPSPALGDGKGNIFDQVRSIVQSSGRVPGPVQRPKAEGGPQSGSLLQSLGGPDASDMLRHFDTCNSALGKALKEYAQRVAMMFDVGVQTGAGFVSGWEAVIVMKDVEHLMELRALGQLFAFLFARLSAADKKHDELLAKVESRSAINTPLENLFKILASTSEKVSQLLVKLTSTTATMDPEAKAEGENILKEAVENTELVQQSIPYLIGLKTSTRWDLETKTGALATKVSRAQRHLAHKEGEPETDAQQAAPAAAQTTTAAEQQPQTARERREIIPPKFSLELGLPLRPYQSPGQIRKDARLAAWERSGGSRSLPSAAQMQSEKYGGGSRLPLIPVPPPTMSVSQQLRRLKDQTAAAMREESEAKEKVEWEAQHSEKLMGQFGEELRRLKQEVLREGGARLQLTESRRGPVKILFTSGGEPVDGETQTEKEHTAHAAVAESSVEARWPALVAMLHQLAEKKAISAEGRTSGEEGSER